jgi:hypothetical protein
MSPSLDAPTYYEHSKGVEGQPYDFFFKWVDADWWTDDTGNVECPLGYVVLLEVDQALITEYMEANHDDFYPEPGWYVTRLMDNGLIWAHTYGTGTLAEEGARADFLEAHEAYCKWNEEGY